MRRSTFFGAVVFFAIVCTFNAGKASAQTPDQERAIRARYNLPLLNQMENEFRIQQANARIQALIYARSRNIPVIIQLADGGTAELQQVEADGTLIYNRTHNVDAARSSRADHLNTGGSTGFNLDGQNMIAYVWDAGHARLTHHEYDGPGGNDRVSVMDASAPSLHDHAAHVTGTIMASGYVARAKGMAPQARVRGYDWTSDLSEATSAAAGGMLLSNHSYGWRQDNLTSNYFGTYMTVARDWDNLHYNAPYYLMVKSAGNNGTTNYNSDPLNPQYPQYDKLTDRAVAKNNLVIASANDASVDADGKLLSVTISSFSSQGPTDDLRIKPDIAGNGAGLYSTLSSGDTNYGSYSGTSMSAPNVTGTLLLLQQHAHSLRGAFLRSSTLKGLVLHTADDAGMTGPDAIFGWGLINGKKAAETLANNGVLSIVVENELQQGETHTFNVNSDGNNPLLASISWTDPPGQATTELNNTTPVLVNDIDIRVSNGSTTHFPWKLTDVHQNARGDNIVDPYERVDIANAAGSYTITISHKGNLTGGKQTYSLIVTGVIVQDDCDPQVPQHLAVSDIAPNSALISWTTVQGMMYDIEYRAAGTGNWTSVTAYSSPRLIDGLTEQTTCQVRIRSRCYNGKVSYYTDIVEFTTLEKEITYCDSYANSDREFISKLELGSIIINESGNNNGYALFDYSDLTLLRGTTYPITIVPEWTGNIRREAYSVWIDFNRNGSFDDAGELVFQQQRTTDPSVTGSIAIPAGAEPGKTRMRVSMKNNTLPGNCETNFSGEVEDYIITIGDPVPDNEPPSTPQELAASGITHNSVQLDWQPSTDNVGVAAYDVYMNNALNASVSTPGLTVYGLNPETSYYFHVVARDAAGNSSGNSNTVTATTLSHVVSYCPSFGSANSREFIEAVTVNGNINMSGNNAGYADFTAHTFNLTRGTNTITIIPGWTDKSRNESYSVWIDYNGNGSFDDPGELVFSQLRTSAASVTGDFTIPAGVASKTTRMRVSMKFNSAPSACETNFNGEVEDYTVYIPEAGNTVNDMGGKSGGSEYGALIIGDPGFVVYPNPTTGKLLLQFKQDVGRGVLYVTDIQGRRLKTMPITDVYAGSSLEIRLDGFARGLYLLQVVTDNSLFNSIISKE